MDNLKKYIDDNRNLFDDEPETGHCERMCMKMDIPAGKTVPLHTWLPIAASVAVLIAVSIMLMKRQEHNIMSMCENASDLKVCYMEKMNIIAGQIDKLASGFDPLDRQQLISDINSIISDSYIGIESDIPDELPDDMTRKILNDYYQHNLACLQMIKQRFSDAYRQY